MEGGVEIGELNFDSTTGHAQIESVRLGPQNQGVVFSDLRFTLDLESMTKKNLVLIRQLAVDRVVLAIDRPVRLLRPVGTADAPAHAGEILQIALPQGVIDELVPPGHPDRTCRDVDITEVGSAAGPLNIDVFLASIFEKLHEASRCVE